MKTSGSGNASWRAAMAKTQIKRGAVNRRICNGIARHSGKPCGKLALRGVARCQYHGGKLMQWNIERQKHAKKKRNDSAKQRADRASNSEQSQKRSEASAIERP